MKFHPSKSKVLSITNQRNMLHNLPFTISQYRLDSTYIDYVSSYVDLGVTVNRPVARAGQGGHDPPMKLTVGCAAGHFAPTRSATKRKVVQTLAQCPPPVLI